MNEYSFTLTKVPAQEKHIKLTRPERLPQLEQEPTEGKGNPCDRKQPIKCRISANLRRLWKSEYIWFKIYSILFLNGQFLDAVATKREWY